MAGVVRKLALLLVLIGSVKSQAQQLGFSLNAQVSSPAVQLSNLQDDWVVDHPGNYAYGRGLLESWFELNEDWAVGYRKRADYLIEFSPDTARFYTRLENGVVDPGEYDLNLHVNALMMEGVFATRKFPLGTKGNLSIDLSGYQGSVVQLGRLSGVGYVDGSNDYRFIYDLDYYFDHSRWLDSPEEPVTGWGYGLGFELDYSLGRSWRLHGVVDDVIANMHWSQVNRDRAECDTNSEKKGLGCDGTSSVVSRKQPIRSASSWKIYGLKGVFRPFLNWHSWGRNESWVFGVLVEKYSMGFDLKDEVVNFTYDSDRLQVKWAFDNINVNDAHHWQISLGTVWPIF